MEFEWDLSEFEEFANNLESLVDFKERMEKATKRIAKALLTRMKDLTPIDEYDLINGWNGNKFAVKTTTNGFEVLIVNKTPYALAVNDGHKVYNKYGGPYRVKRRIQVRSPHQYQADASEWYVFGHFFVERGIVRLKNTTEIENIIMDELQKWWESV